MGKREEALVMIIESRCLDYFDIITGRWDQPSIREMSVEVCGARVRSLKARLERISRTIVN
jgi:hypothetical protein